MIRAILRWLGYVPAEELAALESSLAEALAFQNHLIVRIEHMKWLRDEARAQKQGRDAKGRFTRT